MKIIILSALFFASSIVTFAQIGVGTTSPKAALDVVSTTSGFMMPRMTTVERAAITVSADQTGMQVYDTTKGSVWLYDGMTWVETASLGAISTLIDIDADTKIEVETTADDDTIRFTVTGSELMQMSKDGIVVDLERSANSSDPLVPVSLSVPERVTVLDKPL